MSRTKPPSTLRIGYARVSTKGQDLTRQIQRLKAERCDQIFSDTASGKSLRGRPQLAAALARLGPGDELILAEWDRATRSMWDGLKIIKDVIDAGATIRVLDRSYIDLSTPMGLALMGLFSAMAQDERARIIRRTGDGRKIAMDKGKRMGRKPKLSPHQQDEALRRLNEGASTRELGRSYNVSHHTIARLSRGPFVRVR